LCMALAMPGQFINHELPGLLRRLRVVSSGNSMSRAS
jgi:hypothetical protein